VFDVFRVSCQRVWTTCFRWNRTHGSILIPSSLPTASQTMCKFRTPRSPESCFEVYVEPLSALWRALSPVSSSTSPSPRVYCMQYNALPPSPPPHIIHTLGFWLKQYVNAKICEYFSSSHPQVLFSTLLCQRSHPLPFYGPQVCDPLIYCVWHANFGWISTNNPTWLQIVSSNICNFFDSFRYSFRAFDVQLSSLSVFRY